MPVALPLLEECFSDLPDPRVERTRAHALMKILLISVSAVICGADGWDDIVAFAHAKRNWLNARLDLGKGIPSADTFRRVFSRLDPVALQACFLKWTKCLHQYTNGEIIALDGKTLRHSFDTACGLDSIHMVSAWAASSRLILGQAKVDAKSNEIPAVPALLALLDIAGCTVTTDAMSCQRATAQQIISQGADYVLAVKDNQPTLNDAIRSRFEYVDAHPFEPSNKTVRNHSDKGHGRIETRRCELITLEADDPLWRDLQQDWLGLRSLARLTCTRQIGDKSTSEVRYFISSLIGNAAQVLRAVRQHWGIENRLHYVLDVSMAEDNCRIRRENGAEAFAVLRHIALNLIRQEKTCPRGIKARRKLAGWNHDYLSQILVSAID